jgi:5-formyltetrahydrofolate cyclo-ligase
MAILNDKAELRARMRRLRKRLAAESPDAGSRLAAHLPEGLIPADAVVALYLPIGAEIDPGSLAQAGQTVLYPVILEPDAPMIFRADAMSPPLRPDVIFAPLIAFDRQGGRLGQGGGHYDRTLAALRAGGTVRVIGVAYAGQEVPRVPAEPHDMALDAILTETGFIRVDKEAP